jgi:hypothetical protein
MTLLRTFAFALACTLPLAAAAQWQWIDKDGRKVFSDKAPPPEVPAKNILRQPGMRAAMTPEAAASAAGASTPAARAGVPAAPVLAASGAGRDKELEARRKKAEAAEAEKKKAQEAELQAQRDDNCARARQAKATFDSGVRMSRTNAKGEREILDDTQRASEVKHLEMVIARDCAKPQ